jgi:hypothetical protein
MYKIEEQNGVYVVNSVPVQQAVQEPATEPENDVQKILDENPYFKLTPEFQNSKIREQAKRAIGVMPISDTTLRARIKNIIQAGM